ncbi:queuosine-tRNA galactosyltransferase isoform X2 [Vanacampus margaritifer]
MKPPKRRRTVQNGAEAAPERQEELQSAVDVSIIMPMYNASCWLDECLQAILYQDFTGIMELSIFDDASTDDSKKVVDAWRERLEGRGISVVISGHNSDQPRGVGYAKNKAVAQSCGKYLCFQDADDIMLPQRVRLQFEASVLHSNTLIGCRVQRLPEGSTERYTRWINTITQDQLLTQVYTSHGPTVIMPTWFCSRDWFLTVGWFTEEGKGVPEDLIFFYESLRQGGLVTRVDRCLLAYRYHEKATTHSVKESVLPRTPSSTHLLLKHSQLPTGIPDSPSSTHTGNHLEPASRIPSGKSPLPMGELHYMECWETGP